MQVNHIVIVFRIDPVQIDGRDDSEEYGNALQEASYEGHEQIVKLLLDKSIDVNAQGGTYGNPSTRLCIGPRTGGEAANFSNPLLSRQAAAGEAAVRIADAFTERPETLPSPSFAILFRRDPDFVDRGTLLDQTHEKCSAPASRIALVSLRGVA